jgi:hypothetical protein
MRPSYFRPRPYVGATTPGTATLTHWPEDRRTRRNPWTAILAVLLGLLAGAVSAIGVSASPSGGTSVSEQTTDTRSTGKPNSVRLDTYDVAIGFGGDDPTAALVADEAPPVGAHHASTTKLQAFHLPIRFARIRDGLTRAPPLA